jgi:hypothetical protein
VGGHRPRAVGGVKKEEAGGRRRKGPKGGGWSETQAKPLRSSVEREKKLSAAVAGAETKSQ